MSLMKRQTNTAPQRGMPVEDVGGSSARVAITGETVAFYYSNSGVRTVDAGQAAGVVVEAVLAYGPIASSSGDQIGVPENTSLSFTSTAFTTEIRLSHEDMERLDGVSFAQKLSLVQTFVANKKTADAGGVPTVMANGDYIVDYRHGVLIGKKASTQTTLTSTAYTICQKSLASIGGVTAETSGADAGSNTSNRLPTSARISGFNGTTWDRIRAGLTTLSATFTGILNTLPWAVYNVTPTVRTEGQGGPLQADTSGSLLNRETMVDQFVDNTNGAAATVNKPLAVGTYAYSIDKSAALEASTVVNAGPCTIRLISGRIDSTAPTDEYYLQRINSTTLPSDGAVTLLDAPTKFQHTSGADTPILIDYTDNCLFASTGAVVCLSTTDFTKTIAGAYLSLTVMYKA